MTRAITAKGGSAFAAASPLRRKSSIALYSLCFAFEHISRELYTQVVLLSMTGQWSSIVQSQNHNICMSIRSI
ncbi:hypothetical protein CYLTODRAFT_213472 [Cylindrobasidium torrendii FP15055 ss-10]|uniref:Uncharacterized protein n=1 Tax=Cylindrobasidium torrendii FP15055 ss-10 TaxID=1314674 RepID=A0A0D7ATL7_9AGAR|nr:hypothetical protein CYLTODRAFT_213472 [Cylindrobasidium torrendii FP15055 ss-10]